MFQGFCAFLEVSFNCIFSGLSKWVQIPFGTLIMASGNRCCLGRLLRLLVGLCLFFLLKLFMRDEVKVFYFQNSFDCNPRSGVIEFSRATLESLTMGWVNWRRDWPFKSEVKVRILAILDTGGCLGNHGPVPRGRGKSHQAQGPPLGS